MVRHRSPLWSLCAIIPEDPVAPLCANFQRLLHPSSVVERGYYIGLLNTLDEAKWPPCFFCKLLLCPSLDETSLSNHMGIFSTSKQSRSGHCKNNPLALGLSKCFTQSHNLSC